MWLLSCASNLWPQKFALNKKGWLFEYISIIFKKYKYIFCSIYTVSFDHYIDNELKPTSPGAKMGTWKCLRVQGFIIDPYFIGVLKEIKLGCHDGNLGELFYVHNS